MDDKLKVLWNLDVLVKMCRSKSDGPSLRVEEIEILDKLEGYKNEIKEIKSITEEDSYDTSAEMADRNIEIITKKQLQTLNAELKDKNKELNRLKNEEKKAYESTNLLRETKDSYEKFVLSMQERVNSVTDSATIERYNNLIRETNEKITATEETLKQESQDYEDIQSKIIDITNKITNLEDTIDKKKKLLAETQANLENKESYIDKEKQEKNAKRISDLEEKVNKINTRLEEIRKDPKYIETKIKDIINSDTDPNDAKNYLVDLINIVVRQPYINVPDDNKLEEELLKATQARDAFANEVDKKSYNVLEANTPEKIRINFLEKRIEKWQEEHDNLEAKVKVIDEDGQFNYKGKDQEINEMISVMKNDLNEFQKAFDETPESNVSLKASLKVSLDEKRNDIVEAEKIASAFRIDEAEDIAEASKTIKIECEKLNENILNAQKEIEKIKNRLLAKKSGLIDISTRNHDKEVLKELAQTVIDLKHRRQFPETPIEVVRRLEEQLQISLSDSIDMDYINETKEIVEKDYSKFLETSYPTITQIQEEPKEIKRGIKVVTEDAIPTSTAESLETVEVAEPKENVTEPTPVESLEELPLEPVEEPASGNEALADELNKYVDNLHTEQ